MEPSDYDILQISSGNIVSVRTAGFEALLAAKAQARSLTSKTGLSPLSDELVNEASREERIVDRGLQEFGTRAATAGPSTSAKGRAAPPPPEPGKAVTYDKYLNAAYNSRDPHIREQYIQLMKETLDKQFDPDGATVGGARHRAHMTGLYHTFLKHHVPDLPVEDYWAETTVREWAELFLVNLVQCSRGRQGLCIRTSSLRRWLTSFIPLIGRYTFNRQGEAVGARLLASGFYLRLRAREKWIARHFKLNRYPGPRGYLSQRDLQAMFEFGIEDTETFGRESFLQTHLSFVIVFHTAIRASSLAASHPKYKEWGQYIKLKDLTIMVREAGIWDVDVKVQHRKGNNEETDPGYALEFRLDAVTQVHNLVFDAGLALLTILLLRDALVDIETVGQLFAYKGKYIRIKPSMLEEPLFRARTVKGQDLTDEPASAKNLAESIKRLGLNVGIPFSTYHAIRRDAANVFGIVFGAEIGRRLLGHAEGETTFDRNYSRGTWNFAVTAARLGELDSTLKPSEQLSIMRQRSVCMIVDAILNSESKPPGDRDTFLEEQALEAKRSIYPNADGKALKGIEDRIKKCDWYADLKDQFLEIKQSIKHLGEMRTEVARQVLKRVRRKSMHQLKTEFLEKKAEHTIERYKEVEEGLVQESSATRVATTPEDLLRAYGHHFFNFDQNSQLVNPVISKSTTPPVPEEDEIILQDDEESQPPNEPQTEERDPEVYQEEDIGRFDDRTEIPVFNIDYLLARLIFFIRLVNPVYKYRELQRKFQENGNQYVCELCALWKHTKPPGMTDKFAVYANFMRHQYEIHTPWEDLRIRMVTSNPEEYKCPSKSCIFEADTVDAVFDHCLEGCPEKDLFQRIQKACIRKRKRDDEAERATRKRARALLDGVELAGESVEMMETITTATDSEILEMATGAKVDQEDLPERISFIREMVRVSLLLLEANSNIMRDENALDPLETICNKLILAEDDQWIEQETSQVDLGDEPLAEFDFDQLVPDEDETFVSDSDDDMIF